MRSNTKSSSSSSSSVSSPARFLTTVIDINRNRSSESTEPTNDDHNSKMSLNINTKSNQHFRSSSASSCSGASVHSAEGRGVPISPKKMPPTPPRDVGSPAHRYGNQTNNRGLFGGVDAPPPQQPFLSPRDASRTASQSSSFGGPPSNFLFRPSQPRSSLTGATSSSSWFGGAKIDDEDQVSSLFRSSPSRSFSSRGSDEGFYTIHRCNAFDEDDDDDEPFYYSDDDDEDGPMMNVSRMAEF